LFLFKKVVAQFFFPLPLCLEILVLGLFLLWFTRRQKTGRLLVSTGVLLLAALSYSPVSGLLLQPLEDRYPPLMNLGNEHHEVKWVVVLGGGHESDPVVPATSRLSAASLTRLVEGIRIHNMLPGTRLLLSGGGPFDPVPEAETMAEVARAVGVNDSDLVLETRSRETRDEAQLIRRIVDNDRCILVTSASHMPRSMALFEKLGMRPLAAPVDHLVKESQGIDPGSFFPSADGLCKSYRAFYEYLALAWARITGQVALPQAQDKQGKD
jgi:uncharacterized SAM-binding protein YcdF (DUF218 family)